MAAIMITMRLRFTDAQYIEGIVAVDGEGREYAEIKPGSIKWPICGAGSQEGVAVGFAPRLNGRP